MASLLPVFLMASVLPLPSRAQNATDKLCSSAWFAAQREQASSKERTFQLLDGGLFSQDGNSYVLTMSHAEGDANLLDFMVFAAPSQSGGLRLAFTDRIAIFDTGELPERESDCVTKGSSVFFGVRVVDLAGNGKQQIVVESNSVGTCSRCLSEVRVYQVQKDKISKVVDEYFADISYGKGQGLWLHSFKVTGKGDVVIEKTFFGAKGPPQQTH